MMRRGTLTSCALAVALLSCNTDRGTGPQPVAGLVAATSTLPTVRISEFHYDNSGTDVGEAIEVSGPAGFNLAGWQLVLYNGTGGLSYNTTVFTGAIPATCSPRGVVVVSYPVNGIQNGSPDGMALVDTSGTVVEFLSYEGTFVAANGPASGMTSVDVGVSELGTEPFTVSLQRSGTGTWSGPIPNTFNVCNDTAPPPPPFIVDVTVAPDSAHVFIGGAQAFTATAFDSGGNPVSPVSFAWSVTDTLIATVSASGLATGHAVGQVGVIAAAPNGVADTALLQVDSAPPPPPAGPVNIVEIHYDNGGTDVGEAVEVEGPAGFDLAGWQLMLYNGTGGLSYNTQPLTGAIPATCGVRGVVVVNYPTNGIQNGSPDGLALVNDSGVVVEFLSYEGTFTATNGPALGMLSTDIGVAESGSEPTGRSLQKDSSGWYGPVTASFGACNVKPPPPANTILFTGRNASDPALPVGFEDQLFATLLDGNGNAVPSTFTWTSETPTVASIDQNGVFRALDSGVAVLRAMAADSTTRTVSLPTRFGVASTTAQYAGNTEFGVPHDADTSDDFIVVHDEYTASYNFHRNTPNWVSYDLEASHFGPEDRCDCFTFDPALPASFTHYTTNNYTGAGAIAGYGIDRGHMTRSFDRTSSSLDNAFTFYFSNVVPQAADLNQGPWAAFETYLGDLARFQDKEVYIVTGVAGNIGTLKNEGLVTIPAATWKVAVIMPHNEGLDSIGDPGDFQLIAVLMPNQPGIRNVPWQTYQTTVDSIESISGYDLLDRLPDWIETIVEANDHFPTANAGGPYTGVEGFPIAFSGAGSSDPDGQPLTYFWNFGDGDTTTGVAPFHIYADNGVFTATVIVRDPFGAMDTASATVTVDNAPPVVASLVVPTAPILVGDPATILVIVTDSGKADTQTLTIDWGDGTVNHDTTHAYGTPGLYTVNVTATDDDGGTGSRTAADFITVIDPAAGFVTGSGWYEFSGKTKFDFTASYKNGAIGAGSAVSLQAPGGGLTFTSSSIAWLVLQPGRAKVRGTGTISGQSGVYEFLLTATDGPDGVRLKIWNSGGVVYDNQPGQPDDSWVVSPLGGGNVSVKER